MKQAEMPFPHTSSSDDDAGCPYHLIQVGIDHNIDDDLDDNDIDALGEALLDDTEAATVLMVEAATVLMLALMSPVRMGALRVMCIGPHTDTYVVRISTMVGDWDVQVTVPELADQALFHECCLIQVGIMYTPQGDWDHLVDQALPRDWSGDHPRALMTAKAHWENIKWGRRRKL